MAFEDGYLAMEDVETVTFTTLEGVVVTGVKAKRRALTRAELSGQVAGIDPQDIPFHLWFGPSSAPASTPRHLDTITDSTGAIWTVISAVYSVMTSRWRAVCRKQV